jgi:hypothetical protein
MDPLHVVQEVKEALPREPTDGERLKHTKHNPIKDCHEGK